MGLQRGSQAGVLLPLGWGRALSSLPVGNKTLVT